MKRTVELRSWLLALLIASGCAAEQPSAVGSAGSAGSLGGAAAANGGAAGAVQAGQAAALGGSVAQSSASGGISAASASGGLVSSGGVGVSSGGVGNDAGQGSGGAPAATGGAKVGGSGSGAVGAGGAAAGAANTGGVAPGGASGHAGAAGQGSSATLAPLHVYLAGDSTVQTYVNSAIHQAGWGQFLQGELDTRAKVDNRAIGGRTARRFIEEGYLDSILEDIAAGDYLLVQFGTNDGNKTATYSHNGATIPYYLDPQTDFKTWLLKYVGAARARSANPVFVTPPPRMSCTGDSHSFGNGLAAYASAMKELGAAEAVPVVDLNQQTLEYLNGIGCVAAGKDFFLIKADGTNDSTHFQEKGAAHMASFVADAIRVLDIGLSRYVK